MLQYRGIEDNYSVEGPNGEIDYNQEVLRTCGCSCCSVQVEINEATVNEAILEAEAWLDRLRELKASL